MTDTPPSPESATRAAPIINYLPRPVGDSSSRPVDAIGEVDADNVDLEAALLDGFSSYIADTGLTMYPAQEEALLELVAGNNVIMNTPTGSGKSLVAEAAHFVALARGQRSVYTAPIKALVSEKFFALTATFGADRVGMVTGDGSVNADAPIVCCTAEILAYQALRDGDRADVDVVIADEFHFYGDPQRGWAWQVPLLELPHVQFVLMSATLGNTEFFERELIERTGRATTIVQSSQRPVPLHFEYRKSTLHQSVEALLEARQVPVYVVYFTQRDATEAAQSFLSLNPLTSDDKARVKELIGEFRFDSPFGKGLHRLLVGGVGVHHAGLLPKYRRLVERLAQAGLLKIICGTDTLGVGVNVPIRTVLFTQLYKYDGNGVRILNAREFHQIAGRAGRRGYDDRGDVWVQAPEYVAENDRLAAAAANDPKKKKKLVRKKPPEKGYAHWTEDTFTRLVGADPEPLTSSFQVNHQMIMSLLDRPGDGCGAVRRLMTDNHDTRKRQRGHIRRAISMYRSLVDADLLEFPAEPDELGRRVRVAVDLQDDFALHQPLSLWALEAIEHLAADQAALAASGVDEGREQTLLEGDSIDHDDVAAAEHRFDGDASPEPLPTGEVDRALGIVTIIEAVQENPAPVIAAQVRRAKDELMSEMKAAHVEYEERIERLANVEPPRPLKHWLFTDFNEFRRRHPWVGGDTVRPKSVARDMFERAMTFGEYVTFYGLKNSEGVVLRYLSDVYKGLVQNVPSDAVTDEFDDIVHWLGAVVRSVDSSLLDEWERLQHPDEGVATPVRPGTVAPPTADDHYDITTDRRAWQTLVRNTAFRWVEQLASGQRPPEASPDVDLDAALAAYYDEFTTIEIGGDARSSSRFRFDERSGEFTQVLHDEQGVDEWELVGHVDLAASRDEDRVVAVLDDLRRRF